MYEWEMAVSKEKLKIEFTGDLSGLSIIVNGKSLYKDKVNTKNKDLSPKQKKEQETHSVISKFARSINSVPVLKRVWDKTEFKRSYRKFKKTDMFGSPAPGKVIPFNKIMGVNRKVNQKTDHPTSNNIFVPENREYLPIYNAILLQDELTVNVSLIKNDSMMEFSYKEQMVTGTAIISSYGPKKICKKRFEIFSRWQTIKEFVPAESCQFSFPLSIKEQEILKKYKNCYLFFTIVTETAFEYIIRCFSSKGITSSLKDYPVSPVHFTNQPVLKKAEVK